MEFVLKPSLEHVTLVKIVISLWNQNDVKALISELCPSDLYSSREWEETIEERIIEKASQLPLPHLLKEKVLGCIKPIGLEVYMWIKRNYKYLHLNLPSELCWTPRGTVDRKRTAEVLVRNDNLDISTRYKLACIYCLENDILKLWNNMTENLKKSVSYKFPLVAFWSRVMKRKGFDSAPISYKNAFYQSAYENNKVAAEYFLQKLIPQERERSLVKTAKCVRDTDTLCFLISEMDKVQQMEVFKNNPYEVLHCFLQWPWQSFFIRMANRMWDFLSTDYYYILDAIICKIEKGFKDCNYQKLLREFLQKSPNALKSLFINEIDKSQLLKFLFRIKDKENIALILKDTTLAIKEDLVYSDEMNAFVECSISDDEWDSLQFFIHELLPSKYEMLKFKREFETRMRRPSSKNCYLARNKHKQAMHSYFKEHFATKKQKWDELFIFCDDSTCKCDKRSVENGECSSSKRFDSLQ